MRQRVTSMLTVSEPARVARRGGTASAPLRQRVAAVLDELASAVAVPSPSLTADALLALQERLRLLGQLAAGMATVPADLVPPDAVGYGSVVNTLDLDTMDAEQYTVTGGQGIDFDAGHVSLASPIGQALLGSRPGDLVTVETPRRTRRLRVTGVQTFHDLLDVFPAAERRLA